MASLWIVLASLIIITALAFAGMHAVSAMSPQAAGAALLVVLLATVLMVKSRPLNQAGTLPIDLFTTRTMLAAIEQMYIPRSFLLDTFFKNIETSMTEVVDIDLYKGARRLAPFVQPFAQGKVIDRIGWTTRTFKPPYIKEKIPTQVVQILKRQMGATIYQGGMTPAEKAAAQLGKDMLELIQMIQRREEWMASQILQNGLVRCVGDDMDVTVNFLMNTTHLITLSGAALWSATTTATPITNLRTWKRLVAQDSGIVPDTVVFGQNVIQEFLANTVEVLVQGALASVRIDRGQIDPENLPEGVTYWGYLKDPGLDVYTYDEWYIDPVTGLTQPMVPADMIFMGSTRARTARHYGAIQDLKALNGELASVQYFPKMWEEEDPSVRWLMVQSAPIPCMHQPDAFLAATVSIA